MNHQAIYNKYPEVVRIQGQEDGSCIPYDKDGSVVEVDALIGNTLPQAILLTILSKYGYFSVIYNQ